MKEKIKYEDVSVVLQGPVSRETMNCINSINKKSVPYVGHFRKKRDRK